MSRNGILSHFLFQILFKIGIDEFILDTYDTIDKLLCVVGIDEHWVAFVDNLKQHVLNSFHVSIVIFYCMTDR